MRRTTNQLTTQPIEQAINVHADKFTKQLIDQASKKFQKVGSASRTYIIRGFKKKEGGGQPI